MQVEFNPAKNAANIKSRGLSFESAGEFDFGTAGIEHDTRKAYPEVWLVAVGFLNKRLHVLCFTPLPLGIRVISFRKANKREVIDYERTRPTD